ncbi:putative Phosphate regulator PhoU [Stutzerimonas xanthomarina]|nr:putative Phosphate regulator PhoU [Stutzerimonas xanthomarina]
MDRPHTDKTYDRDLAELSEILERMGLDCIKIVNMAGASLRNNVLPDLGVAVECERNTQSLAERVEHSTMHLVAKRQPVSGDLREILASMRIASEFRRIAVLSRGVVERAAQMHVTPEMTELRNDFSKLVNVTMEYVNRVQEARSSNDVEALESLGKYDEVVDAVFNDLSAQIIDSLAQHPDQTLSLTHALFCAKNIERIGDHASHIADAWYLAKTGRLPSRH